MIKHNAALSGRLCTTATECALCTDSSMCAETVVCVHRYSLTQSPEGHLTPTLVLIYAKETIRYRGRERESERERVRERERERERERKRERERERGRGREREGGRRQLSWHVTRETCYVKQGQIWSKYIKKFSYITEPCCTILLQTIIYIFFKFQVERKCQHLLTSHG